MHCMAHRAKTAADSHQKDEPGHLPRIGMMEFLQLPVIMNTQNKKHEIGEKDHWLKYRIAKQGNVCIIKVQFTCAKLHFFCDRKNPRLYFLFVFLFEYACDLARKLFDLHVFLLDGSRCNIADCAFLERLGDIRIKNDKAGELAVLV